MIEATALLAAFPVQILAMSVLFPAWLIRHVRMQARSIPADRFVQLYPGIDLDRFVERFVNRYRAANSAIAALGLLPLGGLFYYLRSPDWDDGPAETVVALYFLVQALPTVLVMSLGLKTFTKALARSPPEGKRKASLQRRGLFDFISPVTVFVTALAYLLFAAFAIYVDRHPFAGYAGAFINLGAITLVYAVNAIAVYAVLYRSRTFNPFETPADRLYLIGLTIKSMVCSNLVCVAFVSIFLALNLLDLPRWEPFALSVFFVSCALLCLVGVTAPPRRTGAERLRSSVVS